MTRALKRGESEIIVEPFSPYIERNLQWMIGKEKDVNGNYLEGDSWTLIEDYEEGIKVSDEGVEYYEEGIKVSDEGVEYYEEQRHVL